MWHVLLTNGEWVQNRNDDSCNALVHALVYGISSAFLAKSANGTYVLMSEEYTDLDGDPANAFTVDGWEYFEVKRSGKCSRLWLQVNV